MASIEEIASALRSLATPGMKPKVLREAIRAKYPDASKKEIVRAAFYALADAASPSQEEMTDLHNFALSDRGADEDHKPLLRTSGKKKKRDRKAAEQPPAH